MKSLLACVSNDSFNPENIMSQNNDSNASTVIAFAVAACAFFAIGIWIGLVILTAVLSLIALVGCFTPVKIGGEILQASEARWFLIRGVIGWFAFPFLILLIAPSFDWRIKDDWIIFLMITGYMIGSTGIAYLMHQLGIGETTEVVAPVQAHSAPQAQSLPALPSPPAEPFRYATWDDEEEMRR